MLRAHVEEHGVWQAVGSSVPAARQPLSNGGILHEHGVLHEHAEGVDERHHAASIRLDPTDEDGIVSAAIDVGGQDFLGCNRLLSAPWPATSTCHKRNPYIQEGRKGGVRYHALTYRKSGRES